MDVQKLCQSILSNIGGAKNVKRLTHCATRLRLT
ncbi:PTS transporter subunit EIIB, partial [Enterococcus faecalis]